MVSAGYNLRQMAQAWLVLDLTGSPLKAGIVNAMPGLAVFTSLYGGAVLDRADRRAVLLRARVALTLLILTAAVLVATGVIQWWYLVLIGLGLSLAFTFHDTANQSFAMDIVGRDRLIAMVQSERQCITTTNTAPAARPGGNGPTVVIDVTPTGVHGIADLGGAGHYEDEYVKTPKGWKFKSRTFIQSRVDVQPPAQGGGGRGGRGQAPAPATPGQPAPAPAGPAPSAPGR